MKVGSFLEWQKRAQINPMIFWAENPKETTPNVEISARTTSLKWNFKLDHLHLPGGVRLLSWLAL
jgi:hypothetical protein